MGRPKSAPRLTAKQGDVDSFKSDLLYQLMKRTEGVVLTDEQVDKANKQIKIKKKANLIKWYNKLPPKEKVLKTEYVSQDTKDTVKRNDQLQKQIKKLSASKFDSSSE